MISRVITYVLIAATVTLLIYVWARFFQAKKNVGKTSEKKEEGLLSSTDAEKEALLGPTADKDDPQPPRPSRLQMTRKQLVLGTLPSSFSN